MVLLVVFSGNQLSTRRHQPSACGLFGDMFVVRPHWIVLNIDSFLLRPFFLDRIKKRKDKVYN